MITRIEKALELAQLRSKLQSKMEENTRELEEAALQCFISIANTVDARDMYRRCHMVQVAAASIRLAERLGFTREERKNMEYSALVYDIGNIGIPDLLFAKRGKLTHKETSIMAGHTLSGAKLLEDVACMEHLKEVARSHHERYDGTGYPNGLKGEEIPIGARIISIVDAYFAMTSDRAYRRRLTKEEACEEIRRMAGTQFDPMLAKEFLAMVEEGELNEQYMEQLVPQTCSLGSGELMHQGNQLLKCILKEQNYVINSMASLDPLTELHNRKYLEVRVHAYLAELSRKGCFCMIDVDNFKQINDAYGHQKGDQVLQSLAEILKRNARETDVVCRIGGDEFVIFYEGLTNHEVIKRKMEQVGREYEKEVLRERVVVDTSLSIGVSITGEQGREYEELYKKADEALYSVKQGGKCRVMICGEEQIEEGKEGAGIAIAAHDIMELLDEKGYRRGAYRVTYSDFQKIYHFLSRCVERTKQKIQLLLLTVQRTEEGLEELSKLEQSVRVLEQGISKNLRRTDVSTRYSSCQYIVILINTDKNGATTVMERIQSYYKEHVENTTYEVAYDIAQVQA